jgi:hypothetical protein
MIRCWHIPVIAAVALALAACATSVNQSPIVVRGGGAVELPSESLTDWVSYGDVVVAVHVDSETQQPETDDVKRTGEGLVGRTVELSVTSTLWTREPKFVAPAKTSVDVWGWVVRDGKKAPTVPLGSSRIEVGHSYILAWTSSGRRPGWTSLGPGAEIPFDQGIAGTGERVGADPGHTDSPATAYQQLKGRDGDSVAALLARTAPDPLAAKYASLPVLERYQRVTSEQ